MDIRQFCIHLCLVLLYNAAFQDYVTARSVVDKLMSSDSSDQHCRYGNQRIPLNSQLEVRPGMTCRCTPQSYADGAYASCWIMEKQKPISRLRRFLLVTYATPKPPTKSTKATTVAPPPFTTRSPPPPITTKGPTAPTPRGSTQSPPPPVVVG